MGRLYFRSGLKLIFSRQAIGSLIVSRLGVKVALCQKVLDDFYFSKQICQISILSFWKSKNRPVPSDLKPPLHILDTVNDLNCKKLLEGVVFKMAIIIRSEIFQKFDFISDKVGIIIVSYF